MESAANPASMSALAMADLQALTLRAAVKVGLGTASLLAVVWLITREPATLIMALGCLAWAGLGFLMIKNHRENALVMLATATLQVVGYEMIADIAAVHTLARLVIILTGVASVLFLYNFETAFLVVYSLFILGVNFLWHGFNGESVADGSISAMAFLAGLFALRWVRDRSLDSASRFVNLFDRAPVSLWEEDFSKVGVWLEGLRAQGVVDLHDHLADNPQVLREGMSLVEVVRVNQAAADFLETDNPEDLTGPLRPETFPDDALPPLLAQFQAIWDGVDQILVEVRRGYTTQGTPLDGLLHWAVPRRFGTPDLSRVIVSVVDVTAMHDARRTLEDSLKSKDELIATVSHELRTPLTTVVGLSMELSESYDQFNKDEALDLLGMIADQSIEVATIVEDLLVAARAESGSLKVAAEPVDLHLEAKATLRGLEIEEEVDCHTMGVVSTVYGDPGRVRQILRNVLVNARRYGTQPIRVIVKDTDGAVQVEVRDRGPAIPHDEREAIFERYYRARQTPGVTSSVGLGLTVSRELARVMGGDLTYSHDGESVFALTLPTTMPQLAAVAG